MDLKEFLDRNCVYWAMPKDSRTIDVDALGLFFWERGGKEFVELNCWKPFNFDSAVRNAKRIYPTNRQSCDFLDALACLGEDRIKELIKGAM